MVLRVNCALRVREYSFANIIEISSRFLLINFFLFSRRDIRAFEKYLFI